MKKYKKAAVGIIAGMCVIIGGSIYCSYNCLSVDYYTAATKKCAGAAVRLAVLSDLHNHTFGKNNSRLIKKVANEHPDAVLILGDILNGDSGDSGTATELVKALAEETPVYYSMGNHELSYMNTTGRNLKKQLEEAGAEILDESYTDVFIKGTSLRLGGIYDYAFPLESQTGEEYQKSNKYKFLKEYQKTDAVKIMLSHRPDSFVLNPVSAQWDIDVILSGHLHGGQVILPLAGGLYGADLGWFPQYASGEFEWGSSKLYITRGLGSDAEKLPRFNNIPQIMILDIKPL